MKIKRMAISVLVFMIVMLSTISYGSDLKEKIYSFVVRSDFEELDSYLNSLKAKGVRGGFEFYEDVYFEFRERQDDLSKLIGVHIADIVFQSYKNGYYSEHETLEDMYRFSLKAIDAENLVVQRVALRVIGHADTDEGFEKVLEVVADGNPRLIASAVLSAVSMCTSYSSKKLEIVLDSINPETRRMAKKTKAGYRERKLETSYCDSVGSRERPWAGEE